MVFMLPMEFLAPSSDDEELDFSDQIAQLALDPMTATFENPADNERQHLKALFVKGRVDGQPMTKILIDGGAAINIMPYVVYRKLGKGDQHLTKTDMMCNTPSVSLHVNHEHCINISIIMITHEHHTMITCHLLYALYDYIACVSCLSDLSG